MGLHRITKGALCGFVIQQKRESLGRPFFEAETYSLGLVGIGIVIAASIGLYRGSIGDMGKIPILGLMGSVGPFLC